MKKVLLLLCCWLTALGLSAASYPDIYIRGEEAGWDNPNENYKFKRDGSTYSIELESLNGNFKIADGSWGDVNHVYNGTISTYGTYTFGRNTGEVNAKASNLKNVRISFTFDVNNQQNALSVKFEQVENGGNEGGDEPEVNPTTHTVYFDNSETKWSTVKCYAYVTGETDQNAGWHGVLMEKVRDNIYSYTSTVKYVTVIFNDGGSNQTGNLEWTDNYIYNKNGKITEYTDSYGRNYPSNLYLIGDLNGWDTNTSVKADKAENGVYTWNKIELPNGDGKEFSLFTFVTAQAPDWNKNNGKDGVNEHDRYGAVGDDEAITSTATIEKYAANVNASSAKNWKVAGAIYNVVADLSTMTLTMEKVGDIEDPDPVEPGDVHYVYYDGTFSSPQVHAWYKENGNDVQCTTAGSWPGDNMVKKDGKWYWELPAGKSLPTQIIIHQGDNKIGGGDLIYADKATYHQDGSYTKPAVKLDPTGTLPVLYINVYDENGGFDNMIINKDLDHKNYFSNAEYWLDVKDCQWMIDEFGAKSVGSAEEPLPLAIKARGNFTRKGYSKKPFKLKLGDKQNLLGINRAGKTSKHWALLAHADDKFGYMRNFVGFRLGEMIGLPWTPNQQPVEVVINGDYRGIYFLTESIRVEKGRIEIESLDDEVSDPALISGGYLIELDNYADDAVVTLKDGSDNNRNLYITPDTPEVYSDAQKKFINEQFTTMNNLVNSGITKWDETSKDGLWSYLDLDDAARYYVVEEIISHYEAYHGSTYLFRDRYSEKNGNGKWHFSPLWDCGHAFDGPTNGYFTQAAPYGNSWINGLRGKTQFMDKVKATFQWFINDGKINNGKIPYDQLCDEINAYADHIAEAAKQDRKRWENAEKPVDYWHEGLGPQDVVDNSDMESMKSKVIDHLNKKITWLKGQWGSGSAESAEPAKDQTLAADLPDYVLPGYVPDTRDLYVINDGGWSDVSIWVYNSDTDHLGSNAFPGVAMTYEPDLIVDGVRGVYHYTIPEEYTSARVIFSQKDKQKRYPADKEPGLEINKRNMVFHTQPDNSSNNYIFVEVTTVENYTPKPYSGTLPVVYISTLQRGATDPVIRYIGYGEDNKVKKCSFSIDGLNTGYESISADIVGNTTIKGRGSEWKDSEKQSNSEFKNSFKIKADNLKDNNIDLLGMGVSAHWVLMPYNYDAVNGLLTNYAGHEMARLLGLNWTPSMEPVELMIDDEYMGLYFLAENVRAAEKRVPIADYGDKVANDKWKDYNKEHDFLFEIDADHDETDVSELFYSWANGDFTHKLITKTPSLEDIKDDKTLKNNAELLAATIDEISGHIDTHITEVQNAVKNAAANIYSEDWTNVIDAKQAAKYYIVQEIMDDDRSFTNNFYMHHTYEDTNEGPAGTKWFFGPVWDFSGALAQDGNKSHLIHEVDNYDGVFIKDLYKNRQFVWIVGAIFHKFKTGDNIGSQVRRYANGVRRASSIQDNFDPEVAEGNDFESALTSISNMAGRLQEAAAKDAEVWPDNASTSEDNDVAARAGALIQKLRSNASYLATNVNEGGAGWNANDITTGVEEIVYGNDEEAEPVYFDLMGRRVAEPQSGNIYVVRRGANVTKEVIR